MKGCHAPKNRVHIRSHMNQGNGVHPEQQMVLAREIDRMPVKLHGEHVELDGRIAREIGNTHMSLSRDRPG